MATATQTAPLIVTKDELSELAEWERKYADAKKKLSAAEKELSFRRMQLAEKVLGVKSAEELKQLNPVQVAKLYAKRLTSGEWKSERGAPVFAFSKTNEGRYPSWSQLYVAEMGETAAARVRAETPVVYSYCVEVAQAS
ncbi:MAG TPA: hypothetical protein VHX11_07810 [Acidobacteriaceae bacterium]|jgi:hypothetical protein|nr:hypothetical protein [Acidobacteriaceae bacterium]